MKALILIGIMLLFMILGLSACGGINVAGTANVAADPVQQLVSATPTPTPACPFDNLILNGANSTDPARTNYWCRIIEYDNAYYQGSTTGQYFALLGDHNGRYAYLNTDPVENITWVYDQVSCTISIKKLGVEKYTLTAPTLNIDNTINAVTVRNLTTSAVVHLVNCYYDTSPGQNW